MEKFEVDRSIPVLVIVPPGQDRRAGERRDVLEQVLTGKIKVIVNVVSYGYHSLGALSYIGHELYQPGMSVEQFLGLYLTERRRQEVEQLKKIAPLLNMSKSSPTLMLTLVTKQDLWWQERDEVKAYYQQSEYNQEVQEILRLRGANNFSHEYVSASLVISNFNSGVGETLAKVTEGYDQNLQFTNLREVFNKIDSFCQHR